MRSRQVMHSTCTWVHVSSLEVYWSFGPQLYPFECILCEATFIWLLCNSVANLFGSRRHIWDQTHVILPDLRAKGDPNGLHFCHCCDAVQYMIFVVNSSILTHMEKYGSMVVPHVSLLRHLLCSHFDPPSPPWTAAEGFVSCPPTHGDTAFQAVHNLETVEKNKWKKDNHI